MLSIAKLIVHRVVRWILFCSSFITPSAGRRILMTLQIREFIVASTTHSPSPLSVVRCPEYVNPLYLHTFSQAITAAFSLHPARYPHYYFPRQDQQTAGYVKHAYNASNS